MSVERLQKLLTELPDSGLDPDLVAWVAGGLTAWGEGTELESALELYRPTLDQRDEWIKLAVSLCPGETDTAKCSYFLDCIAGNRQHPEEAGQRLIEKLITQPVNVQLSIKQLMRILSGRRQDGWWLQGT